jgi:hypothetical protein
MRYIAAVLFAIVLSSVAPKHHGEAVAQDFSYSQQKEVKNEYRRYKKRYRRSYRRPRIVVRPRAVVKPVRSAFEQIKNPEVITFDWFKEKPEEMYPWDYVVRVKTVPVYAPDVFNPMDKEAQEIIWRKRFFYAIWGTFVMVLLFFVYAVFGFVTTKVNVVPVDTKA